MTRLVAKWITWDEPDRAIAVAQWTERDVSIVFPIHWAAVFGQQEMVSRAKERIAEVEQKSGRILTPGSVLLAFSRHVECLPRTQRVNPDVSRGLLPTIADGSTRA